jgi:hypothetical protein
MSATHKYFIAMFLLLALGACSEKEESPQLAAASEPAASTPPTTAPPPPPPAAPAAVKEVPAPEIVVSKLTLGSAADAEKKITEAKTVFGLKDQIFASVETQNGSPSAELMAKWTAADGRVINENTISFSPEADAISLFKITSSGDWPEGKYKLEIMLNGKPAQSAEFEVKK